MLEYRYKAYVTGVKEQAVEMAINGSGIRDTSKVLGVSKSTVISTLKNKENRLVKVNPKIDTLSLGKYTKVSVCLACEDVKVDEQWSFVSKKSNQRWLWHAVDHATNTVLHTSLVSVKMTFLKSSRRSCLPLISSDFSRMTGERMNGISTRASMKLAREIHKKLREKI